jgi:RNA polymerase-associated protein LEO1
LFDVNQSIDTSAGVTRQSIGFSQSQSQSQSNPTKTPSKSQGLTYLVAQHKRSQVLQSEAVITGYLSLRPTGMQSETHRMLVRAVGQKHNKISRLRIAPDPVIDPERAILDLMKKNAKKSKKKADDPDGFGSGRKRRSSRRGADTGVMWSDDDDDRPGMYSEEEDDDRSGNRGSPRKMKRKAGEEKGEDYQADDFLVPDDSEDDGEGGGRSRKKVRETSEMEEDPLDRLEANLEQQVADKKRADKKPIGSPRKGKKKKQDDNDDETEEEGGDLMDVESEEEDEEFKVRRVTGKRTVAFDEEEE